MTSSEHGNDVDVRGTDVAAGIASGNGQAENVDGENRAESAAAPASTSPSSPTTPDGADDDAQSRSIENSIGQALAGLDETSELPLAEHVERFETVHSVLADALNRAENSLSGSSGSGG